MILFRVFCDHAISSRAVATTISEPISPANTAVENPQNEIAHVFANLQPSSWPNHCSLDQPLLFDETLPCLCGRGKSPLHSTRNFHSALYTFETVPGDISESF